MPRWLLVGIGAVGGLALAATSSTATAAAPFYESVSFVDSQRGAVVADSCAKPGCPTLLLTSDGGQSWRRVRVPGHGQPLDGRQAGAGIVFASRKNRMYRSLDGGERWTRVPLGGTLLAWDARGTGAWVITNPCGSRRACAPRLWHSADAGRHWFFVTLRDAAREPDQKPPFDLSFIDAADGAALYERRDGTYALARTEDGGHRWLTAAAPCTG